MISEDRDENKDRDVNSEIFHKTGIDRIQTSEILFVYMYVYV